MLLAPSIAARFELIVAGSCAWTRRVDDWIAQNVPTVEVPCSLTSLTHRFKYRGNIRSKAREKVINKKHEARNQTAAKRKKCSGTLLSRLVSVTFERVTLFENRSYTNRVEMKYCTVEGCKIFRLRCMFGDSRWVNVPRRKEPDALYMSWIANVSTWEYSKDCQKSKLYKVSLEI